MNRPGDAGIWARLGIAPTGDIGAIRRAYAQALRRTHPEDDPEGFTALRAAYEAALRQAEGRRTPAASARPFEAAVPVVPTPAPATAAGTDASSPDAAMPASPAAAAETRALQAATERLRSDCHALQILLSGAEPPDERRALELQTACLASSALESVDLQFTVEAWFAALLWKHRERAEALLDPAIERFHWRAPGRAHPLLPLLVAYADRVRELRQLETQTPRAYKALTRAPRAVWLWLQIVVLRLDDEVRPAWAALTAPHAGATLPTPCAADAGALMWWRGYFTGAHVQPRLLRLTGLFILLGALAGANGLFGNTAFAYDIVRGAGAGAALGLTLTLLQFVCIEWSRRRWRAARPTWWRRLGWFPAAFALCLIAAPLPADALSIASVALAGAGVLAWAILAEPAHGDARSLNSMRRSLGRLMMNVPLAVWGLWLHAREPALLPAPLMVASVAWVAASSLSQSLLWVEVRYALSPGARRRARGSLAGLAVLALLVLLHGMVPENAGRLLFVGLLGIVLLQRVAAMGLTSAQLKQRYYVTVLPALLGFASIMTVDDPLRIGGAILMAGVPLTLMAWEWNEWRATRGEQRRASVARAGL